MNFVFYIIFAALGLFMLIYSGSSHASMSSGAKLITRIIGIILLAANVFMIIAETLLKATS